MNASDEVSDFLVVVGGIGEGGGVENCSDQGWGPRLGCCRGVSTSARGYPNSEKEEGQNNGQAGGR